MSVGLAVLVVFVYLCYLVLKHLTYWKRNGVPQQSMTQILKDNFNLLSQKKTVVELIRNYSKSFPNHRYFGVYQLFNKFLLVQDPELIKEISTTNLNHFSDHAAFGKDYEPLWDRNLLALRGQEWKEMRSTLNPNYTSSKMKLMFDWVLTCTNQVVDHFHDQLENEFSSEFDFKDIYSRYTSDVMAITAYGFTSNSLKHPNNDFYINSKGMFTYSKLTNKLRSFLLVNAPSIAKLFGFTFFAKAGSNYFLKLISKNIRDRIEKSIVRKDLLQLLIEARDNPKKGSISFNDIDITAQAMAFFFAGVDSTSTFLCFISYELASNPDIQKRLQKEVDEAVEKCNGSITYAALQEMKYIDMVVSESLRKWGPVLLDRICTKPYVIEPKNPGETPIHLRKGDVVWFPVFGMQRDPKYFHNPDQFDPERFNDHNKSDISQYVYMSFGVGPRGCIAKRFARMEMKLVIAQILTKFEFVVVNKTPDPLGFTNLSALSVLVDQFSLGLRPRHFS